MKRILAYFALLSSFLFLTAVSAAAQHGQGGGNKPPTPGPPSHGQGHGSQGAAPRGSDMRPSDTNRGRSDSSSQPRKTVSEQLKANTKLAAHLQKLFPQGTDLQQASAGFKNLGEFVAAAHVANNLNLPFDQLKATMVGPPPKSLGDAIHQLKPDADAKAEANKAKAQANKVIKETKS